jgi:hypothetical protein
MGYLASKSAFVIIDADTGRLVSDKAYSSIGYANRYITHGSYAKNRVIVELSPEIMLELLRKQREESK